MTITVTDVDDKKVFATVRAGSIYLQFQNVRGKLKYNCKWKYFRSGKFYVPYKEFLKAADKAAEALNVPKWSRKKNNRPGPKQLSLF